MSIQDFSLAIITLVVLVSACVSHKDAPRSLSELDQTGDSLCPLPGSRESEEDCPWAGLVRRALKETSASQAWSQLLEAAPAPFTQSLLRGEADRKLLPYWGQSINFDEAAKAETVSPLLLEPLLAMFGLRMEEGGGKALAHAGLIHTYGYVLSNLPTSFGFKRQRWVRGEVENGLGLPKDILSPLHPSGLFFRNVSYTMGRLAFRRHPELQSSLASWDVPASLKEFSFDALPMTRIEEELDIGEVRPLVLRTDVLAFPLRAGERGANSHWLIYTVEDPREAQMQLITAFPVNDGFVADLKKPGRFGEEQAIKPRYNAFVKGVSDRAKPLLGNRRILSL